MKQNVTPHIWEGPGQGASVDSWGGNTGIEESEDNLRSLSYGKQVVQGIHVEPRIERSTEKWWRGQGLLLGYQNLQIYSVSLFLFFPVFLFL